MGPTGLKRNHVRFSSLAPNAKQFINISLDCDFSWLVYPVLTLIHFIIQPPHHRVPLIHKYSLFHFEGTVKHALSFILCYTVYDYWFWWFGLYWLSSCPWLSHLLIFPNDLYWEKVLFTGNWILQIYEWTHDLCHDLHQYDDNNFFFTLLVSIVLQSNFECWQTPWEASIFDKEERDILTSFWPGRTKWQLPIQIKFSCLWVGTNMTTLILQDWQQPKTEWNKRP